MFDPITLTLSGTPSTPGSFTVTIIGNDGSLEDSTSFTFQIFAPPINSLPNGLLKFGAEPSLIVGPDGSRLQVRDDDSAVLTVKLSCDHGLLTLNNPTGLELIEGSGVNDKILVIKGPIASLNTALTRLLYQAPAGFFGLDVLTIQSTDELGLTDIDKSDPPFSVSLTTFGGTNANALISSLAQSGRQVP